MPERRPLHGAESPHQEGDSFTFGLSFRFFPSNYPCRDPPLALSSRRECENLVTTAPGISFDLRPRRSWAQGAESGVHGSQVQGGGLCQAPW